MNSAHPWHISVLIPARNEEDLLPRCLASVLRAKKAVKHDASVDVVVVDDSSADRTAQIAAEMLYSHGTVHAISAGKVGAARRIAARIALERCATPMNCCWLANTDADCIVPPAWLVDQLALAETGIEAVAGTVSVDSFDEHGPDVFSRFTSSYLIRPDGTHPHVHGANLGMRGDSYLRAGGWDDLETAEDHDLWGRLARVGARKLSTSRLEVQTSGRRIGRAPHGFADTLAAHNETAA